MPAERSPVRLAVAVLAAVLLAQLGFGLAMATIRWKSNDQAAAESVRLMQGRLSQVAADLSSIANDYNHWTEA
jgi:sensor domain CHASE-containing protein